MITLGLAKNIIIGQANISNIGAQIDVDSGFPLATGQLWAGRRGLEPS